MTGPRATVLFATHNGAKTLPRMLTALCRTTLPREQWKLVAVDNNSRDETRAILDSFRDRLPLTVLFEPRPGKEYALALGFPQIEGELLILTDDDVIPEPDWIAEFLAAAAAHPGHDIFGGLIRPEWEKPPAAWVLEKAHLGVLFALNDELAEGPIPAKLVSGPNSAFRRRALGPSYPVSGVGPNASARQYPMGQDTAFALALERQGARAWFTRGPKVGHIVRPAYVEAAWMLRRAERYGMGLRAVQPELFSEKPKLMGVPLATALLWAAMTPAALVSAALPDPSAGFSLRWGQAVRRGILRQSLAERGEPPRSSENASSFAERERAR